MELFSFFFVCKESSLEGRVTDLNAEGVKDRTPYPNRTDQI